MSPDMPARRRPRAKPPAAAGKQRRSSGQTAPAAGAPQPVNAGQFRTGNPYRWKPGQSGNPAGARKGPRLSDLLHQALQAPMPADQALALQDLIAAGATIGEIIAWAAGLKAAGGDLEALAVIADRTEGAPEQTVHVHDLTGDDLALARAKAVAWEVGRFPVKADVPAGPPHPPEPAAAPRAESEIPTPPAEAPSGQP